MPLNEYDELLSGQAPERNEYDQLLQQTAQRDGLALRQAVKQGATTTPDAKAKALEIADRLRVPVEIVERNPELFRGRDAIERLPYDDLVRQSPKLSEWLQQPHNAALAQDDVEVLGRLERTLSFGASVRRGVDVAQSMLFGAAEATGEALGADGLTAYGRAGREANTAQATSRGPAGADFFAIRGFWDLAQWGKEVVGAQIPIMAPIIGGAVAGGAVGSVVPGVGTTIGAAIGAFLPSLAMGVGEVQSGIKEQDPNASAPATAFIGGSAIAALDTVLPGRIGSRLVRTFGREAAEAVGKRALAAAVKPQHIRRAVGALGGGMATEGLTEALQEAIGAVAVAQGTGTAVGDDLWKQMVEAGAAGALMGGAVGGIDIVSQRRQAQAVAARQGEATLTAIGQTIAESKTAQRLPQAAQDFIARATKDGPLETVYAPLDTWTTYWQERGMDPAQVAEELTGNPRAYEQAVATGEDLAIPTAAYAVKIAGTAHNAYFAKELRFAPEQMNAREAEAFEAEAANALETPPERPQDALDVAPIRENIVAQLEATGVERPIAESYATLYEETFGTLGQRAGVDPVELFNRYGLQILREGVQPELTTAPGQAQSGGTDGLRLPTKGAAPSRVPSADDTRTASLRAQADEAGRTADYRVEPSLAPARESRKQQVARRDQHYADVFGAVLAAARAVDPSVDETALRTEFDERVALLDELDAEYRESGHNPRTLLEAIAKYGGISVEAEANGGWHGELKWIRESPSFGAFGAFGGVRGVFRERERGARGLDRTGLSLDDMLRMLEQDPQFSYIESIQDLFDALEDVARLGGNVERGATYPGTRDLARRAGMHLDRAWWQPAEESTEFNQGLFDELADEFDALDTGEQQPRLPEAGDVREQEIATPQFEAPFALTSEVAKPAKGKQTTLFQGERPSFQRVEQFARLQAREPDGVRRLVGALAPDARDLFGSETAAEQLLSAALTSEAAIEPSTAVGLFLNRFGVRLAQRRQTTLFQDPTDKRGAIRFGKDRQFRIDLLAKADLSTFLHETGHFYLEVFGDLVDQLSAAADPTTLTDPQKRMLADYGAILEWLGVESRDGIAVAQHEQWARAFEAYLMEGKAPSAQLRSSFARFRAWLIGIYRSLTGLRVELSPEVRGVFDRLLATDEAITAAELEGEVAPLFTDAESAGMTPEAFADYQRTVQTAADSARADVDRRLLDEQQREQRDWWLQEQGKVRADVSVEVFNRPVYRALAAILHGTNADGTPLVEGQDPQPIKFAKEALVSLVGLDGLKPFQKPYLYTVKPTGVHPDTVAELFGFSSGDELLKAIVAAPPVDQVIAAETDARMKARHGDLLTERDRLLDVAEGAVHQRRFEVIATELKALTARTAVRAAAPPAALVNAAAARRIARLRVRELRPGTFLMAARRASQQAFSLVGSGDYVGAVKAKQQELMALALYRHARDAREGAESQHTALQKFTKASTRQRIGLAGADYLEQIDGFLDRYELARVTNRGLDRRASLRTWVGQQERLGLPVEIPESVLDDARQVNWRELTVEELTGVYDAVQHIAHLARLKNRLLKSAEKRELEAVTSDLATSIREHGRPRVSSIETRLPADQAARAVDGFFASHRKLASIARELDGFADGGVVWEHVIRPINEAGNAEAEMNAAATRALAGIVEASYPAKQRARLYDKQHIPAIDGSLSRMARLMVALNWGNEGNRSRIRSGYGWNDQQVQAVLDTLDERDWRFVQGVWTFINAYWPEIAAKQKRVTGVAPEKVEAAPFNTRFGPMAGGYFPLKYEGRLSAQAQGFDDLTEVNLQKSAAYVKATTRRGHTEARVENVTLPVRLDFGVIFEHVQQVIHDLSHHEMLIDVGRVLGHKAVQQAIYETQGDMVYRQMKEAVKDVAFGDVPATGHVERAMNHLRQGATVAGLAWNMTTALLQPIGLTQSMVRIGPKWVGRGLSRWLRGPEGFVGTVHWINERSTFMRLRGQTQQREINEIRNQVGVNTGRFSGWVDEAFRTSTLDTVTKQGVADSFFFFIQQLQRVADVPTWLGAYEKARAENNDEARAVALADQAVLDAQGGGQIKDLASVQRGGPWLKLWTNFYSFFNTTYQLTAESTRRTNFKNPGQVGRLAVDYVLLYTLPASLGFALRDAMKGGDDEEGWIEGLVRENLSYLMGTMMLLREFSGAVQGYYGYEGPAGARGFSAANRLAQQAGQGELDAAFWKALNDAAGVLLHYPAGQVRRTVDGIAALAEGKTRNPMALVTGGPR